MITDYVCVDYYTYLTIQYPTWFVSFGNWTEEIRRASVCYCETVETLRLLELIRIIWGDTETFDRNGKILLILLVVTVS